MEKLSKGKLIEKNKNSFSIGMRCFYGEIAFLSSDVLLWNSFTLQQSLKFASLLREVPEANLNLWKEVLGLRGLEKLKVRDMSPCVKYRLKFMILSLANPKFQLLYNFNCFKSYIIKSIILDILEAQRHTFDSGIIFSSHRIPVTIGSVDKIMIPHHQKCKEINMSNFLLLKGKNIILKIFIKKIFSKATIKEKKIQAKYLTKLESSLAIKLTKLKSPEKNDKNIEHCYNISEESSEHWDNLFEKLEKEKLDGHIEDFCINSESDIEFLQREISQLENLSLFGYDVSSITKLLTV